MLLHLLRLPQAIDILKTTELYVPHLKEDRAMCSDPVATDLVGALLAVRILPLFYMKKIINLQTFTRSRFFLFTDFLLFD